MAFCTVINCMDGRIQVPVIEFLRQRFGVDHVDNITEPGPVRILAYGQEEATIRSIMTRVSISVERHDSKAVAVVGHHDCAGNPVSEERQKEQIAQAVEYLRDAYPDLDVIGLWVDDQWKVNEVA